MIELTKERYPSMSRIDNIYPASEHLLGHTIYWTVKEDGSNVGLYLKDGDLMMRSRNMLIADSRFMAVFMAIDDGRLAKNVKMLLEDLERGNSNQKIIYGELCFKGSSPTRIEVHDEDKFYMFDIASVENDVVTFYQYNMMHQLGYHYHIPVVTLVGVTKHACMDSLYEYKNKFLDLMKEANKEGVVGKVYNITEVGQLFFKEKNDLPKYDKIEVYREEGAIHVDYLDDSEAISEVVKAFDDSPADIWRNPKEMMPTIVGYIQAECKRRYRRPPKNMFNMYTDELKRRLT